MINQRKVTKIKIKIKDFCYIGGITSEFIEKIGGEIDLVFIDTMHITPGEMLDWLQVLPFLKEGAFVVLNNAFFMYWDEKVIKSKLNFPNNQFLSYIRGELLYFLIRETILIRSQIFFIRMNMNINYKVGHLKN